MKLFRTIDDNYAYSDKVCGYCKHYGAMLTEGQVKTHNCLWRNNNEPCQRLIKFEWEYKGK